MSEPMEPMAQARALLELVAVTAESHMREASGYRQVARRARIGIEALDAKPDCDQVWHPYSLELEMWNAVLDTCLRVERRATLTEALDRAMNREPTWDTPGLRDALGWVHPGLVPADDAAVCRSRLAVIESLATFRRRPTVAVLDEALRGASEHARAVVEGYGHRPCTVDTGRASSVLADALMEVVPRVYQRALAALMFRALWNRWAGPDEVRYANHTTPEVMTRDFSGACDELILNCAEAPPVDGPWLPDEHEAALEPFKDWTLDDWLGRGPRPTAGGG